MKWKTRVPGMGKSSPIVWGQRVFMLTAVPTGRKVDAPAPAPAAATGSGDSAPPGRPEGGRGRMAGPKPTEVHQFVVLCLDRQTGKVVWQKTAAEKVPHEGFRVGEGSFASASAVTDGQQVFAFFGSRGLYAYDLDGKLLWDQQLGEMRVAMSFGEGSSPVLYRDTLIVNWDHEGESFIVAMDKRTGKTLWRNPRAERTSWSTPLVIEQDGKPQVIVSATGKIRGYGLADGKVLWECGGLTSNVIPCPVVREDTVYAMSGFRGNSLLAIRLGRQGDLTGTDAVVWSYGKNTPYVPSPLLYDNRLYFFSNNKGVLTCLEASSGKPLIDGENLEALEGVYASPVGADERVYLVGRNGTTVVIKHADKLEALATNRLEEKLDASPAIAGSDLFLRGLENLYCLSEK